MSIENEDIEALRAVLKVLWDTSTACGIIHRIVEQTYEDQLPDFEDMMQIGLVVNQLREKLGIGVEAMDSLRGIDIGPREGEDTQEIWDEAFRQVRNQVHASLVKPTGQPPAAS
ncbi:hypothetical protein TspCOW1_29720 [Thiohalobacter sp. COW1]|uniref:hypothetical protein n=1 Tax=Thiohalobacter sp. COW1 TaxID=2795687 RepID=UPI0019159488|nr:hypothetical protein [Thiohalobacter sp. COW1]BCO32869.1 hypothetical protein TspCOW1_29720 [Thiohalobacter sp. COW1]